MKIQMGDMPVDQEVVLSGLPEGYDALVLATLAERAVQETKTTLLHIGDDEKRIQTLCATLKFFSPEVETVLFPAWDCLPYDRIGPRPQIVAERLAALHLLATCPANRPRVVLTTLDAALQRVPPPSWIQNKVLRLHTKLSLPMNNLISFLVHHGYSRMEQVYEHGDYAVRGGLVDVFPPGINRPFRIDFFGDTVESIRSFDVLSQRTSGTHEQLEILPMREFALDDQSVVRFRSGYREAFGPPRETDPLYIAIGEGRLYDGADHWLPLFHERLATLLDFVGDSTVTIDSLARDKARQRLDDIRDFYIARHDNLINKDKNSVPYKPLPSEMLYVAAGEWDKALQKCRPKILTPFKVPESKNVVMFPVKADQSFLPNKDGKTSNAYDALHAYIRFLSQQEKRILIAASSKGSKNRLVKILADHNIGPLKDVSSLSELLALSVRQIALGVLALERGFETDRFALITESSILGERLPRRATARHGGTFLCDITSLQKDDLVVHVQHGIGRFVGLEAITVEGNQHDCLRLEYQDNDRLFLPVENIEMLSHYGETASDVLLDKLGGTAWQTRQAKLKKRIREMAEALIRVAAARAAKKGVVIHQPSDSYDEFSARFPFAETEDQLRAIDDIVSDLERGRPMDRLICGDVGFGKTEVALRAVFAAVSAGHQAAIITPTTLLARQHFNTFRARFQGLPFVIEELSRLVPAKRATITREGLRLGKIDIVIGTHALLSNSVNFARLGLLVVDEEQHFGVVHKERIKELKSDVHVLTLTATPIPRTLQMALTGLRDMSLIATPPVDRLAVRTYVSPFDEIVLREAIVREQSRKGQTYFIVPRISDIQEIVNFLRHNLPDVKFVVAHGQMAARAIEDAMTSFYEGKRDVLVSTSIIESGLDIPNANTLIVHHADRFGLAQLYQLRGRVGRSKTRAYAYLTYLSQKPLSAQAQKRLHVLQSLDTLGAGFTLAAQDMDIRGAGNLLGEEQSGHIKEVGVELYQKMLEEAVQEQRESKVQEDTAWSPQISIPASVLIPEAYVGDLSLRLSLYRRLASLRTRQEIQIFQDELADRFGPIPQELAHLLTITIIKLELKRAGVEKIEAGSKGVTVAFRNNSLRNPEGLAQFLSSHGMNARFRPDHRLVIPMRWASVEDKLKSLLSVAEGLSALAQP